MRLGKAAAKREQRAMCAAIALLVLTLSPVFAIIGAATFAPSWAPMIVVILKASPF